MEQRHVNGTMNGLKPHDGNLVNYEALLRLFECNGCKDWVTPPIYHCRKGHLVCCSCKQNMKANSCHVCKQRLLDTSNIAMEQVALTIAFPCKFQSQGCSECLFLDSKATHEAFCSFRPVPCQYATNGCKEVLQFQDMVEHVKVCLHKLSRQMSLTTQTNSVTTHSEVKRAASFASRLKTTISIRSKD
ncbi:E3 ubiquitin-protein ligase sina-like isoform X1 [Artemia franciscana]|uniref:E3 ubiquitin-protein ligase sina-like isoform X1 n=1 Tax=Artemia franciscana TaxID=6661 RepID=UPI0032DB91A8